MCSALAVAGGYFLGRRLAGHRACGHGAGAEPDAGGQNKLCFEANSAPCAACICRASLKGPDRGWAGTAGALSTCGTDTYNHTQLQLLACSPPACSVIQGRWYDDSSLLTLPHFTEAAAAQLAAAGLAHLPQLLQALWAGGKAKQSAAAAIEAAVGQREARDVMSVCERLPVVGVSWQAPLLVQRAGEDVEGSSSGSSTSYSIEIELQRLAGKGGSRQSPPRVYAPRFPKVCCGLLVLVRCDLRRPESSGWWLHGGVCLQRLAGCQVLPHTPVGSLS